MMSSRHSLTAPSPAMSQRPLYVVHLIETLGPGGAERLLHKFKTAISRMEQSFWQLVGNETIPVIRFNPR